MFKKINQKRILVIDDEPSITDIIEIYFSGRALVTTAHTPEEAIMQTKTQTFDIALVDYNLTNGNGDDLLSTLKQINPGTVYIGMSADPANTDRFLSAGAESFIEKPFSCSDMDSLVAT